MDDGAVGALSGPAAVDTASFQHALHLHRQLHRFLLPVGLRFWRRARRLDQLADLQSPCRLGALHLRRALPLQLLVRRHQFLGERQQGHERVVEKLAIGAAIPGPHRPASDHHNRHRQLAHRPQQRSAEPGAVGLARDRRLRHAMRSACSISNNGSCFTPNPIGTYGDVGRNAVRGPGFFGFDLSLSRSFKINERYSLQVRADAFNILNHTNFVGGFAPAGQPAGASYGTSSNSTKFVDFRPDHAARTTRAFCSSR